MAQNRYARLTIEKFYEILVSIIEGMSAEQILGYGEVYSFFAEEFNNEVLEKWEEQEIPEITQITPESHPDIWQTLQP